MSGRVMIRPCDYWWYAELHQMGRSINSIALADGRGANAVHSALIRIGRHKAHVFRGPLQEDRPASRFMVAPTAKERPCMCCREQFLSEGPHNRLCGNCRGKNAGPAAVAIVTSSRKWVSA
jgi:hypothetical protein